MTAYFVAAAVVVLVHYVRVRDRRVLPLAASFAFLGLAEATEYWVARRWLQAGGIAAGLALLATLAPGGEPRGEPRR